MDAEKGHGLRKKTKLELINIIFRKDDVEKKLQEQIVKLKDRNAKLEKEILNIKASSYSNTRSLIKTIRSVIKSICHKITKERPNEK